MATEQLANFAYTTVTGGYTAGSGLLNVASTATGSGIQPFPTSGNFSVSISDHTTSPPTPKTLLEVTAINSGTQFAVTNNATTPDVNMNAGDIVQIVQDARSVAATMPITATMWHDESKVLVGGAITLAYSGASAYALDVFQASNANGDSFSNSFVIAPGTYVLSVVGTAFSNRGKIDWYIDNVLVISAQDWYNAGVVVQVLTASVTVSGFGPHVLKGTVNGKNASSSGFVIDLQKMWLS